MLIYGCSILVLKTSLLYRDSRFVDPPFSLPPVISRVELSKKIRIVVYCLCRYERYNTGRIVTSPQATVIQL
jgi:hypothetical protein